MNSSKTSYRTTFALDDTARKRIQKLARKWQVSQAEVIRRSLEKVEKIEEEKEQNPLILLDQLSSAGAMLSEDEAASYLAKNSKDRKVWRNSNI